MASLDFQILCRFMDNGPLLNLPSRPTGSPPAGEGAKARSGRRGRGVTRMGGGGVAEEIQLDHYAARGAL